MDKNKKDELLSHLAGLRRVYERAEEEAGQEISTELKTKQQENKFKIHTVKTADLEFKPNDIKKDCRSLGPSGQEKIANRLAEKLSTIIL